MAKSGRGAGPLAAHGEQWTRTGCVVRPTEIIRTRTISAWQGVVPELTRSFSGGARDGRDRHGLDLRWNVRIRCHAASARVLHGFTGRCRTRNGSPPRWPRPPVDAVQRRAGGDTSHVDAQDSDPVDQTTRDAARVQAQRIVRLTTALKGGLATARARHPAEHHSGPAGRTTSYGPAGPGVGARPAGRRSGRPAAPWWPERLRMRVRGTAQLWTADGSIHTTSQV